MLSGELKKKASKFLESLQDKDLQKRIVHAIEHLQEDPFPKDAVRVEGFTEEKVFRVRVGKYRIEYYVDYKNNTLWILDIDKRGRIYN